MNACAIIVAGSIGSRLGQESIRNGVYNLEESLLIEVAELSFTERRAA